MFYTALDRSGSIQLNISFEPRSCGSHKVRDRSTPATKAAFLSSMGMTTPPPISITGSVGLILHWGPRGEQKGGKRQRDGSR